MTETTAIFHKGQMVRYSQIGKDRLSPKFPDKIGRVCGDTIGPTARVQWVGLKTPSSYHVSFIELIKHDEPLSPDVLVKFSHVEES